MDSLVSGTSMTAPLALCSRAESLLTPSSSASTRNLPVASIQVRMRLFLAALDVRSVRSIVGRDSPGSAIGSTNEPRLTVPLLIEPAYPCTMGSGLGSMTST